MIILLFICAFVVIYYLPAIEARAKQRDELNELRRTIRINLSILRPELEELFAVVDDLGETPDSAEADRLLKEAASVLELQYGLQQYSQIQLGNIISHVFAAMGKSTQARRLLGACKPYTAHC
jgi:hypothetical protein